MYITFYLYDEIAEQYQGNNLRVEPGGSIYLDDQHIATDIRCYECRYFILEKDYQVPNYTLDDARWITKMVVSQRKPKPNLALPKRKRKPARCKKHNSLIKTLSTEPYIRGCPKCVKE